MLEAKPTTRACCSSSTQISAALLQLRNRRRLKWTNMLPLPLGRLAYQDITIHAEMSAILGVRILRLLEAVKLRKPIDVASLGRHYEGNRVDRLQVARSRPLLYLSRSI